MDFLTAGRAVLVLPAVFLAEADERVDFFAAARAVVVLPTAFLAAVDVFAPLERLGFLRGLMVAMRLSVEMRRARSGML